MVDGNELAVPKIIKRKKGRDAPEEVGEEGGLGRNEEIEEDEVVPTNRPQKVQKQSMRIDLLLEENERVVGIIHVSERSELFFDPPLG